MEEYSVRPLEEKDLRLVLDWRNSERVHSKMLTDHKITWEEHLAWFQRSKDNPVKRNLVFCYQGRPIGYIGYTEYDDVNMVCSPGAYLGETDVPIDAGITLFYIAVEYAFAKLHMKSLETSVFKSNKQAMRIDKFLGYKEDISLFACHQANKMILQSLAEKLSVAVEKIPFTAGDCGNESSASIPMVLTASQNKDLSKVLCCGFGVGLSAGAFIYDFIQPIFPSQLWMYVIAKKWKMLLRILWEQMANCMVVFMRLV